jgi:hypothetical protein
MIFHQSPITKYVVTGPPQEYSSTIDGSPVPSDGCDFCFQPYPMYGLSNPISNSVYFANPYTVSTVGSNPVYSGWHMGRAVNVFLDTPFWPTSALQVNVRIVAGGSSIGLRPVIHVVPNAVIRNPYQESLDTVASIPLTPFNTFIRGNPVYPNGKLWNEETGVLVDGNFWYGNEIGLPTLFNDGKSGALSVGEIRLVYSGKLDNIVPAGSRVGTDMKYWVKPTDTIELTPVIATTTGSNLASANRVAAYDAANNKHPILTAVKQISNLSEWAIEFNALIDNSIGNGPVEFGYPTWSGCGSYYNFDTSGDGPNKMAYAANEIYFLISVVDNGKFSTYTIKSLAKDELICNVVGRDVAGNIVFRGRLAGAANLTYFNNNSARIKNTYLDPSRQLQLSFDELKAGAKPDRCNSSAANLTNPDIGYNLQVGKDASGIQPIRSLAIYDQGTSGVSTTGPNVLAITVTPL